MLSSQTDIEKKKEMALKFHKMDKLFPTTAVQLQTHTCSQNTHLTSTTVSHFPPWRPQRSEKHWQNFSPPLSLCCLAGRTFTINRKHLSQCRKCYSLIGLMWFNDLAELSQWDGRYFKRRYKRGTRPLHKAQKAQRFHTDTTVRSQLNFCKAGTVRRRITKHIWFHCCFMDPITHRETTV